MRALCRFGLHSWRYESGGEYITLGYCRRCGEPDHALCHQLISIERKLWEDMSNSQWSRDEQRAVVLRELRKYAGYSDTSVYAFFYDTLGYRLDFSRLRMRPSPMAAEAARRLHKHHPLTVHRDTV